MSYDEIDGCLLYHIQNRLNLTDAAIRRTFVMIVPRTVKAASRVYSIDALVTDLQSLYFRLFLYFY